MLLTFGIAFSIGASAQGAEFPSQPVRIVVPYPAGGFNDTLGRLAADRLGAAWKQPVIVDNRPGAGTQIGTHAVATATPDGHTILVVQFPFAVNPWIYRKLPYDSEKDFAPVMLAGRSPMMVLANSNAPYRTVEDLVNAAKAKPDSINYGTSGPGSSNHLGMALLEYLSGARMQQVSYKGSTPMLTDLASGQVDVAVDLLPHALPFLQTGKVRALAMATRERSSLLPDLPTAAESGVKNFEAFGWHGFMVPAGTPRNVINKINRELNSMLANPEVVKVFRKEGVLPAGGTPEDFGEFVDTQMAMWKKVVQERHITLD